MAPNALDVEGLSCAVRLSVAAEREGEWEVRAELLSYPAREHVAEGAEPFRADEREKVAAAAGDFARALRGGSPGVEALAFEAVGILRGVFQRLLFPEAVRRHVFALRQGARDDRPLCIRLLADDRLAGLPWECALAEMGPVSWRPMARLVLIRDPRLDAREERVRTAERIQVVLAGSEADRMNAVERALRRPASEVRRHAEGSAPAGAHAVHAVGELPPAAAHPDLVLAWIEAGERSIEAAQAWVREGAPFAVAVPCVLPATVSARLAESFYDHLYRGEPLDAALAAARQEAAESFPNMPWWLATVAVSSSRTLALFRLRPAGSRRSTRRTERHLVVFFTDVVGSRQIFTELGDEKAVEAIKRQEGICLQALGAHRGKLIKTQGDSVMATFESVREAAAAGLEIQREMARYNAAPAFARPIHLRIGLHGGPAVTEGGAEAEDVYGQVVNLAAHINKLAEPGTIFLSSDVHDRLPEDLREEFRYAGPELFKGLDSWVEIYRTTADLVSASTSLPTVADTYVEWDLGSFPKADAFLARATAGEGPRQEAVVQDRLVRVGKSKDCDLSFPDDAYLSRHHAFLAVVRGIPWIFDNASKAGVFVEDCGAPRPLRVVRRAPLRTGQTATLSSVRLTVEPRGEA